MFTQLVAKHLEPYAEKILGDYRGGFVDVGLQLIRFSV